MGQTLKEVVPKEFYRGDMNKPMADDVGSLITELERLPKGMPIFQGFGEGCALAVFNIDQGAYLEILEADEGEMEL